jgi:hypothetical protein
MGKLLYLALGAVGLYIVIGGRFSIASGSILLPIAGLALVGGLWASQRKHGSGSALALIVVVMFVVFGFALRSGLIR